MVKDIIKQGEKAPNFIATDVSGHKIELSDFSKSYLLIAFLRYAGCPWCNLAVHRLAVEHPLLRESKCEIIALIQSPKSSIKKSIFERHKLKPNFPIIADPEMKIYKKYHVSTSVPRALSYAVRHIPAWVESVYKEGYKQTEIDGSLFLVPATFLVSPGDQKIIRADYNSDLYDHDSFTHIYDTIAEHDIHGLN